MILLQDSKFCADRCDMRLWHELRYVRTLWSREDEDKLQQDCASITDGDNIHSASNAVLWTASFDRYGVPLSDIFTYGLRPHPSNLRLPRKKLLGTQFCDLLTSVMVHPIFQGNAALLRYVLQMIVRMRVGLHVPPMGTMPDMDNNNLDQVNVLADTLLLEEDTPDERVLVHADAYLLISQKHGARFHPEIVMLEDMLVVHFSNQGYEHTAPQDNAPYSRSLFYLQLWDLRFLLDVLKGLSFRTSYLPVDRYKAMWITDTPKIQEYIAQKLDTLVQQWFLSDERNYRIRDSLKYDPKKKRLYDIPEEDFSPTYARSQYVTHSMRAVLEGEYLEAICPPPEMDTSVEGSNSNDSYVAQSPGTPRSMADIPIDREQEPGSGTDAAQLPVNLNSSPKDMPIRSVEENPCMGTAGAALDSQHASPEPKIKEEAEVTPDDKDEDKNEDRTEYKNEDQSEDQDEDHDEEMNRDDSGVYDGDAEDSEYGDDQSCPTRRTSIASIQSMTSSKAADYERDSRDDSPEQGYFPRRGLPPSLQW